MEEIVPSTGGPVDQTIEEESSDGSIRGHSKFIIKNFARELERMKIGDKIAQDPFGVGGIEWRLVAFPRGNTQGKGENLALFLDIPEILKEPEQRRIPANWSVCVHFTLRALRHAAPGSDDELAPYTKETHHTFVANGGSDWGFSTFLAVRDIVDPTQGYLDAEGSLHLEVDLTISDDVANTAYDSRAKTGCVGLKNQGATCYMNSLLQTLFHLNAFRKAVYQMPTSAEEVAEKSLPLALQQVFWKLQYSRGCVGTKALTSSFGWQESDAFEQHDVQELYRILCDRLEQKMKGSAVEKYLNYLFEGTFYQYIQCLNVPFKSERSEPFQDLSLLVKDCRDIYDSFDKYVETEEFKGENQYDAGPEHGKQDAIKGVKFQEFPPILQLHLMRFEYDFYRDMTVKNNGQYKFYDTIDLDQGEGKYLAPKADRSKSNKYRLHSVLVHTGTGHGGHYFAFIRPNGKQWLKFDDEKVTKERKERAIEDQWGEAPEETHGVAFAPRGGYGTINIRGGRTSNAYMLVYIRESQWSEIMCETSEDDLEESLRDRFRREMEAKEAARREKAEAHLFTSIRYFSDADIAQRMDSGSVFELAESSAKHRRWRKDDTLAAFREEVAREMALPPSALRFWLCNRRKNETTRAEVYIPEERMAAPLRDLQLQLQQTHYSLSMGDLRLFVEVAKDEAAFPAPPAASELLLFFKEFIPEGDTGRVVYRGSALLDMNLTDAQVLELVAGPAGHERYTLIEEVKNTPEVMLEPFKCAHGTLEKNELVSGDILILQPCAVPEGTRYPTALEFFTYVKGRRVVTFRPIDARAEGFQLELQENATYDQVSEALCRHLGLPSPLHVQLWCKSYYEKPAALPVKYGDKKTLGELINPFLSYGYLSQNSPRGAAAAPAGPYILFFKPLEVPLPEYEKLREYTVDYYSRRGDYECSVRVCLPEQGKVSDLEATVLERLREGDASAAPAAPLRVMSLARNRIVKVYAPDTALQYVPTTTELRVEEAGEEGGAATDDERLVQVVHVMPNNSSRPHNAAPVLFKLQRGDTVGSVIERLRLRLQPPPEDDVATWRLGLLHQTRNQFEAFENQEPGAPIDIATFRESSKSKELFLQYDVALGLEHEDKVPLSQRRQPKSGPALHSHGGGPTLKIS